MSHYIAIIIIYTQIIRSELSQLNASVSLSGQLTSLYQRLFQSVLDVNQRRATPQQPSHAALMTEVCRGADITDYWTEPNPLQSCVSGC